MTRDDIDTEIDWWFQQWGRWMAADHAEIEADVGHRKSSVPFMSGGISSEDSFEHLVDAADLRMIELVDTAISQLSGQHYAAVCNRYLRCVWSHRGDPIIVLRESMRMVRVYLERLGALT